MDNRNIDFIARHYRKGRFSTDAGWRRLGIAPPVRVIRFRVAAAVAAAVILSATAALVYRGLDTEHKPDTTTAEPAISPLTEVRGIDFENAPLTEVVAKIESVYGVRVTGIPDNTAGYTLSLHYEGNPADLIGLINDILGTQMSVEEK